MRQVLLVPVYRPADPGGARAKPRAPARVPGLPVTESLPALLLPVVAVWRPRKPLLPGWLDQVPERVHLVFSPQSRVAGAGRSPAAVADASSAVVELHLD